MERGWNIPDEYLDELPEVLHSMATESYPHPETGINVYEDGPVRIQAIKLILDMKKQNIAEGLVSDGEESSEEVDNEEGIETRRSEILSFIEEKDSAGEDSGRARTAGKRTRKTDGAKAPAKKRTTKRKA